MSRFLEQINKITRRPVPFAPPLKTGTVTGINGSRYLVFDGEDEIEVESGVVGPLEVNDTVWLCRGKSNSVVIAAVGVNEGNE